MGRLEWNPAIRLGVLSLAIGAIGFAAFVFARTASDDQGVFAAPPPDATPWYWPLLRAEESQARPDGTFNGIQIGLEVAPEFAACDGDKTTRGPVEPALATELDPRPALLPEGATAGNVQPYGVYCGDILVGAVLEVDIPPRDEPVRYGGLVSVYRNRSKQAVLDYAADRLSLISVGDRPSVLVEPLTEDGFGNSAVVINEAFGVTIVRADGVTTSELLSIVTSLRGVGTNVQ